MSPADGTERIDTEIKRLDQLRTADQRAVEAALAAAKEAVAAALAASEKAVNKAETSQAGVNASQNEFRQTLRDQAQTFMPRNETENLVREIRALIADHGSQLADMRSRLDVGPPSLANLQTRSDENVGRRAGAVDLRTLLFSLVAAGASIIGIVAWLVKP